MPKNAFQKLVKKVSDHYDSDIIVFVGPIDRPYDDNFIRRVQNYKRRTNVLMVLTTLGGDPNAAYRMARCLQEQYKTVGGGPLGQVNTNDVTGKFRLFVDMRCKSAGTILATGANSIMFSDFGELGPIDVQLRKSDEVGERSSGLTPMHSLVSLQALAIKQFAESFRELRFNEQLAFSTKIASEIAVEMTVGMYSPIYGQIDPLRVGEFDRAMRIASEYGGRLSKGNLKEGALKKLLEGYPSHGFVIDRKEAAELFNEVETPTDDLLALGEVCRGWWYDDHLTAETPMFLYLTTDEVLAADEEEQPNATAQTANVIDAGATAGVAQSAS